VNQQQSPRTHERSARGRFRVCEQKNQTNDVLLLNSLVVVITPSILSIMIFLLVFAFVRLWVVFVVMLVVLVLLVEFEVGDSGGVG